MQREPRALAAFQRQLAQLGRVHAGDVEEARTEFIYIPAAQRACAGELDVVGYDHDVARAIGGVYRARSVGEDRVFYAEELEQAHRNDQLLEIIALVGVEAPRHAHDLLAGDRAEDQLACMGSDGGDQKIGDIRIIHDDGIFNRIGKGSQAGTQHDGHFRRVGHDTFQVVGGCLEIFIAVLHAFFLHILAMFGF